MFVDICGLAILSGEEDASECAHRLERVPTRVTSALVVLEAAMWLSTKLAVEPMDVEATIGDRLREGQNRNRAD